jgi:hypothetical protein
MAGRLQGKVAIVSGAGCVGPGWGNGRAMAVIFAQEGAKVFAADKSLDAMTETLARVREAGGEIEPHECDAIDSAQVAKMMRACRARYGRIDILVNNVGGSAAGGVAELSEDAWDAQMDYNLKTAFLGCKHAIPLMVAQGGGAIVNIASASGTRWSGSAQVGYAASKAGVLQLSRVTAVQYADKGIRVNTVVRASCTRRWSRCGSRGSAPAATSTRCSRRACRASRSASWVTAATPPTRHSISPPTRRASSPAPRSWSTAA